MAGCDRAEDDFADREEALQERTAIRHYAEAIPRVLPLQEAWVEAVQTAARQKDTAAIASAYEGEVAPALDRYHKAIALIAPSSPELRAIHAQMVAAHATLLDRYRAFAVGLDGTNVQERLQRLSEGVGSFHTQEREYRARLTDHYEAHGVDLTPAPPLRLTP